MPWILVVMMYSASSCCYALSSTYKIIMMVYISCGGMWHVVGLGTVSKTAHLVPASE